MITDEAVYAAAFAVYGSGFDGSPQKEAWLADFRIALEAAAPHLMAGVKALADAWESRGEYDMAFSKTIPDEDIAMELLTGGAQKVENARHIRNAIGATK